MATTQQRVRTNISVRNWAATTNVVVNEVQRVWLALVQARGLPNTYLTERRDLITNGLWTWLSMQHLNRAILEVYSEGSTGATERWDLVFDYAPPGSGLDADVRGEWKTYIDEIVAFTGALAELPPGSIYRVVVDLKPEVGGQPPAHVEGWGPTRLLSTEGMSARPVRSGEPVIRADLIGVGLEYWGRAQESEPRS